jgi:hypothetical protein
MYYEQRQRSVLITKMYNEAFADTKMELEETITIKKSYFS